MPRAFIAIEDFPGRHQELLRQAGFEVIQSSGAPPSGGEELIALLRDAEAVIAAGEAYTDQVLEHLPRLRVIARSGTGYDRVDVAAATRRGVVLTITPTANHEAVAEHTLALILDLAKGISREDRALRLGVWYRGVPGVPLRGKTLGLVGLGRIGKSVARRAGPFRMRLLAHEARPDVDFAKEHKIELVGLEELLSKSDFVSLHVPISELTRELINEQTLRFMKRGGYLINTSRGGLIEEPALLRALQSGQLAGAGLDVFAAEPLPPDHPFLGLANVVLTAHHAGTDSRSTQDMAAEAAQCIVDLHRGAWPAPSVVNPELRPGWRW